jgi:hypothetical protein
LADELLPEYEARVLKRAGEQTLSQLKQSVKRAVLRLDPATAEQRRLRAKADRNIRVADAGEGMGWLVMLLPIDQAKACYTRADAIARTAGKDDPRTTDQLRTQHAREIAADRTGTWRRLITDPIFGQVIDYGTMRYRPPKHLTELVIARDGTCTTATTSANTKPAGKSEETTTVPPPGRAPKGQYTTRPPERWTLPNAA